MSFEGDCAALFESLKSIQCNQGKFKNFSDELLQTLTKIDKNELKACKQVDDLSINKLDLWLNKNGEENASVVIFDENESKNIYDKSVIKTFQSHNHKNITSNKFPYLKKGQGLSRFNYKICKGFKKKSLNATDSKNSVVIDNIATPVIPNEYQEKRNPSFEKLEALVERESFCSTSSKVSRLLQESLSFSNPVVSPDRKLVLGKQATIFFVNNDNQTCSDKDIQAWKNVENNTNNVDNTPLFTSSQIFISGILKKSNRSTIKNSSKISSPLAGKVKFLEEGVKILEYENEENITSCSDDTDLLSFSDFENLALTNVDMNLNEEDLLTARDNAFSLIERNEKSQSISENSLNSKSLLCRNKLEVDNKDIFPQQNCTKVESLGDKSLKMLLLAKIYELDKEINIFKTKNKYLKESKKQEEKPVSEKLENSFTSKNYYISKSKLKNSGHCAQKDALSSEVSPQVQKELINLEKEYNLLMKENPSLRTRKTRIKKIINERETSIKKVNKCKIGVKQVNEFKTIKNVYGNPVSMQGHVSYQSQNMNIKPNVSSNITYPINSGKKAPVTTDSENLNFCTTTTNSSLHKRSLIEQDNQKTDDLSLPKTKRENAGNSILALGENTEIPLKSSGLPFKLSSSSGENCQRTNMRDILEDFVTKKDENIKPITSRETSSDLLLIAKNKSSFDTHCSRDATESFKVTSSIVKTNENQKMKVKQSEEIFSHKQDMTFNDLIEINDNIENGLLTTGRENCNILTYPNGDKEFHYSDKKVYYYAINNSTRTSYINEGREELKFANGQKEIYYSDGSYEVIFPDSSSKIVYEDGTEICIYQNGTKIQTNRDKTKIISFSNDQKEIYKNDSTWRVYPDGTTKILYKDGREETRYGSGKIRFKEVIKQSF